MRGRKDARAWARIAVMACLLGTGLAVPTTWAAEPPPLMNYEGVLRDPNGAPLDGTFDMTFRFFDDPNLGSEILRDAHTGAGSQVTVTGGVFNVILGSGTVQDGTGPGIYTNLGQVFRDFTDVWMEVEIEAELLSPRIRVVSSAYALNASHLDGVDSSGFLGRDRADSSTADVPGYLYEFRNSSLASGAGGIKVRANATLSAPSGIWRALETTVGTDDSTSGDGGVNNYGVYSNAFGSGLTPGATVSNISLYGVSSGDSNLGGDTRNYGVYGLANGSGNAYNYGAVGIANTSTTGNNFGVYGQASNSGGGNAWAGYFAGDVEVTGELLLSGRTLAFPGSNPTISGPFVYGANTSLWLLAGDNDTDDLYLYAGNSSSDGSISMYGDGEIRYQAGNGSHQFYNGSTFNTATLDGNGNLEIANNLTVNGTKILFPGAVYALSGPFISGTSGVLYMLAGDIDTDDLVLQAGNSYDDGSLYLNGDGTVEIYSGNGTFNFHDGSAVGTPVRATLDSAGSLSLQGYLDPDLDLDLLDGTIATVSSSPADFTFAGANMELNLGDSGADNVNVPGNLFVTGTKSFIQNHPGRSDLSIAYVALEGSEAGTYTRGSGRTTGGEARVSLDATFAWTTNPEIGLTAHVTPRGGWSDLYVASVTTGELVVRSRDGSDGDFDYVVYGLRIGHEEHPVVQPRRMDAPVPSAEAARLRFAGMEDLRQYTALERFRAMGAASSGEAASRAAGSGEAGAGGTSIEAGTGTAATALRQAVGTHARIRDEEPAAIEAAVQAPTLDAPPAGLLSPSDDAGSSVPGTEVEIGRHAAAGVPMDAGGHAYARSFRPEDREMASWFPVSAAVEPGDLVVADRESPGRVRPGEIESDPAVVGVVSGRPGLLMGAAAGEGEEDLRAPIAVAGTVMAKADATWGPIQVGDLLTVSPTPGHAMRSDDPRPGTIVGKALESLEDGTGLIRILVMLR